MELQNVNEINIVPIKPQNGLVGFVSFVFANSFYFGNIAIFTKLSGGYRLVYPTKKVGNANLNIYYPINKEIAQHIENEIFIKFEKVMNNDRHSSTNNK